MPVTATGRQRLTERQNLKYRHTIRKQEVWQSVITDKKRWTDWETIDKLGKRDRTNKNKQKNRHANNRDKQRTKLKNREAPFHTLLQLSLPSSPQMPFIV